jgi:ATP-binding cassette subfamily C (CFTR/MRP) protein 1
LSLNAMLAPRAFEYQAIDAVLLPCCLCDLILLLAIFLTYLAFYAALRLVGVATIRAYRREVYFTLASDALMELNAAAFVSQRAAAGWLALRLDLLGVGVILLTAVLSISGGISPALAGLCLVYALDMTVGGWWLRCAGECMGAVLCHAVVMFAGLWFVCVSCRESWSAF